MTPKHILITVLSLFSIAIFAQDQQPTRLSGDVQLNMRDNQIKALYKLTNIQLDKAKMSFLLNDEYDVNQVYLNGKPIASSKNGRNCRDCKVHTIWIDRPITNQDIISIDVEGTFKYLSDGGSKADLGKLSKKDGVLMADGASNWYPVIMDYNATVAKHQQKQEYTYDLKITCASCKQIVIGDSAAQGSGSTFTSKTPTDNITLLAGNLSNSVITENNNEVAKNKVEKKVAQNNVSLSN